MRSIHAVLALAMCLVAMTGCSSAMLLSDSEKSSPSTVDHHGWLGTETIRTRFGDFDFKGGYPTPQSAEALLDQLKFNRAVEVYLTQLPAVSIIESRRGFANFGAKTSNQVIIFEQLLDAQTLLLTANTETVYGVGCLNLKTDGPTVIEAPPKMLGIAMDMRQRYLVDIGMAGPDKGEGGRYLFLPPEYSGDVPTGYFVVKSPTYTVQYGVRGFLKDGKTDEAVGLMKQIKIYSLAKKDNPPKMEFLNGSGKEVDTIHSDNFSFYEQLAQLVNEEPADLFTPLERFYMQAIGIEHGKLFKPDEKTKNLLSDAARYGAATARANSFASDDRGTYYYDDKQWQYVGDVPYTWMANGILQVDRRAYAYYMAVGSSPAMMAKNVGVGSYYLWTYKDAKGQFLQGENTYKLHIPTNVPAGLFWSVVVYDALSRSELRNGEPFPSLSTYTDPKKNAEGSVDVFFGPSVPVGHEKNWVKTVPGHGFFPMIRFYSPKKELFDKTWKLPDMEEVK
ncbi:MAG TPA: DUF1254 domain-containing protein [Tepidisphaeraceae bacterium]|nr:DUF1254 domain-containing protein [Tepidisphaeraceae bacterium]